MTNAIQTFLNNFSLNPKLKNLTKILDLRLSWEIFEMRR